MYRWPEGWETKAGRGREDKLERREEDEEVREVRLQNGNYISNVLTAQSMLRLLPVSECCSTLVPQYAGGSEKQA
jgi:hypothetical protein